MSDTRRRLAAHRRRLRCGGRTYPAAEKALERQARPSSAMEAEMNDRHTFVLLLVVTALAGYIGWTHPALIPALTFALLVFGAAYMFMKL